MLSLNQPLRILFVEDESSDALLIQRELAKAGLLGQHQRVWNAAEMQAALESSDWDLILSDHSMPTFSAPEAIALARKIRPEIPIIIVSGEIDLDLAVTLLRSGARDYVRKSDLKRLSLAVEREMREVQSERDRLAMQAALEESEEALRQKTEELEKFFSSALDLLCIADTDGYFRRLNKHWETTLGYPIEELEGKQFLDLVHPDDVQSTLDAMATLDSGQEILNFTNRYRCKNGAYRVLEWRSSPAGKLIYAATRDITDRLKNEEANRETAEKYRILFEAASDAIFMIQDSKYSDCNKKTLEVLGCSREQLIGHTLWELSPSIQADGRNSDESASQKITDALDGIDQHFVWQFLRPDGLVIDIEISLTRLHDNANNTLLCIARDITERNKTEKEIMRSQSLLRSLIDSIPDLIFYKNTNSVYLGCNKAFIEYFGHPEEGIIGHTDYDFFDKETADFYTQKDRAMLEAGVARSNEEWLTAHDGQRIIAETLKTPYMGPDGERLGLIGISRDITDRKRAEDLFNKAFKENPCAMTISNIETGRYMEVNDSFLTILGFGKDEVIGRTTTELNIYKNPDDRSKVVSAVKEKGRAYNLEIEFLAKSGEVKVGLFFGEIIEVLGTPTLLSTVLDITDQRLAESALSQSQERLRSLIEVIPDLFFVLRHNGEVVEWHAADDKHLYVHPDQLIGKSIYSILPQEVSSRLQQAVQLILNDGETYDSFTYDLLMADETCSYEARLFPFGADTVMAIIRDVTERKRAEEEIINLNAELEHKVEERTNELAEANRRLESFAYSLSHDLRAPLRRIKGFVEILMEDYNTVLDKQAYRYLETIISSSNRMSDLTDAMLGLSKLTNVKPTTKSVNLSQLVLSIMDEISLLRSEQSISFQCEPDIIAVADEILIRTALYNLLDNAAKYSSKTVNPIISFGRINENDRDIYFVKDNGAGFDMASSDNLFTPFKRLHKQDDYPGLGVGLATVQKIIEQHGGFIWAESSPGQGSTFFFTLK